MKSPVLAWHRTIIDNNKMRIFEKDGSSNIITTKPKFVYKNGMYDCFLWLSWWTKILLTLGLFGIKYAVFGSFYLLANTWLEQFAVEESMCIFNVYNFRDAFAFAMETSLSVGFGSKYPNSECPPSILLVVLNFLFVGFITSQWCGFFLANYVASDVSSTFMFSNQAAITMIGNSLFLQVFLFFALLYFKTVACIRFGWLDQDFQQK